MIRKTLACTLFLLASAPLCASADNAIAKFKGGIGVDPISSAPGPGPTAATVNRNIVRGVQPPGQLWTISDLAAVVTDDGRISVSGKGLLLAGGNGIATNANAKVFATLICEAAAPFTERSTDLGGVALEANGDFNIEDVISPIATDCASPVLLIRNAANLAWFAAGIPKR
ncbi:MAG TPA: hypothetical protein VFJ62_04930 [Usitatibacter sp.]|nr:hypothetical protein [Usitatibacter sp.]